MNNQSSVDKNQPELSLAVGRILASSLLKKSQTSSRLLQYLLIQTLQGKIQITPYHIVSEVLDIEEGFDAHSNPIVRVQCSRLRKLLNTYYETEGRDDPWRVIIPPGKYVLTLEPGQTDVSRFGPTIAVLPLLNQSGNSEISEGMTREIIYALTQSRELRLMAPDTVFKFRNRTAEPAAVGRTLGVDYAINGSIRTNRSNIRITLQLTDVRLGQIMWSGDYELELTSPSVDQFLEEAAQRITSVLVGPSGTIDRLSRGKPHQFSSYAAVLKFYSHIETYTPESHKSAKGALELAVQESPQYAEAWACLAGIYCNEYMFGFNPEPDTPPLDRALFAAKRAVQLAPDCVMGQYGLALTYYYRGEFEMFRDAAERALSLAPYRSDLLASLGLHLAYDGQWERGLQMLDRARALNPLHPGWYWFPYSADAYRRQDYPQALLYAGRLNMPDFFWCPLFTAAIQAQLGHDSRALAALNNAVELNPALKTSAREIIARIFPDESLVDGFMLGLAKAGLPRQ